MAYRRKLTALFISAAFVLTLLYPSFSLQKNCPMTTAMAAIPARSAKRSICASGRFPSVRLSRSRRTMEDPFPSPHLFSAVLSLSAVSLLTVSSTLVTLRVKLTD